jgi:6-phosphogluconolactonase
MRTMKQLVFFLLVTAAVPVFSQSPYLFVGTYTHGKSLGIYVFRFNESTGESMPVDSIRSANPSYLAIAADGKHVFAVNEGSDGMVSAYSFEPSTGKLRFLNSQSTQGADPCYVSVDKTGKWLMVANYSGGSLAAFPLNADGSIAPAAQVIRHEGNTGPVKGNQDKPHVHSVIFSPDERFLLVADLGQDREHIYSFDPSLPTPLAEAADSVLALDPGTGPRHIAFHLSKPFAYLIGELSGTVDVLSYNAATGSLKPVTRYMNYPKAPNPMPSSADIHTSPDGKFLYASNRGNQNSIAAYQIREDGTLTHPEIVSSGGTHPRNFVIDPMGHFLLAANGDSDNIVVFKIDPATGRLTASGQQIRIPNPVCLKFLTP